MQLTLMLPLHPPCVLSWLQRLVAFREAQPTKDLISDAIQQQVRVGSKAG